MNSSYAPEHGAHNPVTGALTSEFDLSAVVQRGIDRNRHKIKAPVWRPRPAQDIEAAVRHLIDYPLSVTRVAVWGLEHGGPHAITETMRDLGLGRRTVERAYAILQRERMTIRLDRWTRSGRSTQWIYEGAPSLRLRDLTDDHGNPPIARSERSWHPATPAQGLSVEPSEVPPKLAGCQDHDNVPLTCGNGQIEGGLEGSRVTRDELVVKFRTFLARVMV